MGNWTARVVGWNHDLEIQRLCAPTEQSRSHGKIVSGCVIGFSQVQIDALLKSPIFPKSGFVAQPRLFA